MKRIPLFVTAFACFSSKHIDTWLYTWYTTGNIIRRETCLDLTPQYKEAYSYFIKNDTLFLFASSGIGKGFSNIPQTYLHYQKY